MKKYNLPESDDKSFMRFYVEHGTTHFNTRVECNNAQREMDHSFWSGCYEILVFQQIYCNTCYETLHRQFSTSMIGKYE